jgi:hypothetical protein
VVVDPKSWPLVHIYWPRVLSDAAFERGIEELHELTVLDEPFVALIEVENAAPPTAYRLSKLLGLARSASVTSPCVAYAVVTESVVARALIDSIRWMHLSSGRWADFSRTATAREWLWQQLNQVPRDLHASA